jgi:hypothetical protein
MMNPGAPMGGGQGNEWLMQLLKALFGGQGQMVGGPPLGQPMGGMPSGIQTGMTQMGTGGGMVGGQAGGFPPQPRVGLPGTIDRTTPPSQSPMTPGQSPWAPPKMPRQGF